MVLKLAVVLISLTFLFYLLLYNRQITLTQQAAVQSQSLPVDSRQSEPFFVPDTASLERIFSGDHSWIATISAERVRTVIATGDIIPARSVNYQVLQHHNFKWPYLKTAYITRNADITFINLETPLIDNCPITQDGMVFCGNVGNIEGLVYAGVDVVSLANNHAGNYGEKGVLETVELLKLNGIDATGTAFSNLVIKDIRGLKFAFLGFNDVSKNQTGIASVNEQNLKVTIGDAKKQADVVIVTFHWGTEYKDQPDDRQKYLGHLAIDSGADLIIGNHPHWIQPIEIYKGKLITYAHGNFVFDQMWSQKTKEGVVGKYFFYDDKLIDVEYFPVQIENFGQPSFVDAQKRQLILDEMKTGSI